MAKVCARATVQCTVVPAVCNLRSMLLAFTTAGEENPPINKSSALKGGERERQIVRGVASYLPPRIVYYSSST